MTRFAVILAMLGQTSLALAQQTAPPDGDRVVLRGRVVTTGDRSSPVRLASIAVVANGRMVDLVFSDAQGRFSAQVPDNVGYVLRATKAGFIPASVTRVSMRVAPESPFEIALTRGGVITGRVRDEKGEPAANVSVRARRVTSADGPTAATAAVDITSQTNDLGEYRLSGLAAGTYSVGVPVPDVPAIVTAPGAPAIVIPPGADLPRMLRPVDDQPPADAIVTVASGQEVSTVHDGVLAGTRVAVRVGADPQPRIMRMTPVPVSGGVVSGTMLDEFGEPAEGVNVELRQVRLLGGGGSIGEGVGARLTDDLGRFRLFGIPPGAYYLFAQPRLDTGSQAYAPVYYPGRAPLAQAAIVNVQDGRELTEMNLTFALTPTARVRGIAVDATGQPLVGSVVMAANLSAGVVSLPGQGASIAEDGTFELRGVAEGDYVLQATGKGSAGDREFGLTRVTVAGSDVGAVVISTSPGSNVSGRVSFEGTVSSLPGRSFGLSVSPADPAYTPARTVYEGGFVDKDGRFQMTGLIGPGRFALEGAPAGWWLKSVTIGDDDVTDRAVTFGEQDHSNVAVVIATTGGRIEGRATGLQATSFLRMSVAVFSTDEARWFYRSRFLRLARIAPDGRFTVSGLPPGEYWIAASETMFEESAYTSWQHADFLTSLIPAARRVRMVEGQRTQVDLRLVPPPR